MLFSQAEKSQKAMSLRKIGRLLSNRLRSGSAELLAMLVKHPRPESSLRRFAI